MVLTKPAEGNINSVFTCLLSLVFWVLLSLVLPFHFPFISETHASVLKFHWQMSFHYTAPLAYLAHKHWSFLISYLITQNFEDSPRCLHLICWRGFYFSKSSNLWSVTTISVSLQMEWKYNCSTTFLYVAYANTTPTRYVISSKKNVTPIWYFLKLFIICPIMRESMLPSS